ncbi:MAG: hypothetical protein U1E92_04230 [Moraxella osloensis]
MTMMGSPLEVIENARVADKGDCAKRRLFNSQFIYTIVTTYGILLFKARWGKGIICVLNNGDFYLGIARWVRWSGGKAAN